MKKIFVLINLISVMLVGCSNTLESNEMEVSAYTTEIDEDGNEIILPEIEQSSDIVEKTFYIQDLLYKLELDTVILTLTENDNGIIYFQLACIGDDVESNVDKMLEIISDNIDNVDFDNSTIIDYGLLETDPDIAFLYP